MRTGGFGLLARCHEYYQRGGAVARPRSPARGGASRRRGTPPSPRRPSARSRPGASPAWLGLGLGLGLGSGSGLGLGTDQRQRQGEARVGRRARGPRGPGRARRRPSCGGAHSPGAAARLPGGWKQRTSGRVGAGPRAPRHALKSQGPPPESRDPPGTPRVGPRERPGCAGRWRVARWAHGGKARLVAREAIKTIGYEADLVLHSATRCQICKRRPRHA